MGPRGHCPDLIFAMRMLPLGQSAPEAPNVKAQHEMPVLVVS